jgi:hypothetical protein
MLADYKEKIQCLLVLEANASAAPKDARLSYESVRDLSITALDAKTRVGITPPHRAAITLNEFVGAMVSILMSRHYVAGATGTPDTGVPRRDAGPRGRRQ